MATYLTLKNQIMRNLGRTGDSDTEEMVRVNFNHIQRQVSYIAEWPSLETVKTCDIYAEVYYYSYDEWDIADMRQILSLYLYDGTQYYKPLGYLTPMDWDNRCMPYISNGSSRPSVYSYFHSYVWLFNIPATDYTANIRFRYNPADIQSASSTEYVDLEEADGLLVALTTAMTWLALEEYENSKYWINMCQMLLKPFRADVRSIIGMEGASRAMSKVSSPTPWADPFVNRSR